MKPTRVVLAAFVVGGCFQPEDPSGQDTGDGTVDDTGGPGTDTTATSTTAGSASNDGPSTTAPTSTSVETGDATSDTDTNTTGNAATCDDGTQDPGEICFGPDPFLVATGVGAYDVVVADITGEGSQDIATLGTFSDMNGQQWRVSRIAGDGVGGFAEPVEGLAPAGAFRLRAGDGENDGTPEVVMVGESEICTVEHEDGFYPNCSDAGGIFGDSTNDMVLLAIDTEIHLDVLHSYAYGLLFHSGVLDGFDYGFAAGTGLPVPGEGASGVAATAFSWDGDEFVDAVFLNRYATDALLVHSDGQGVFVAGEQFAVCPDSPGSLHVDIGDVDGDGYEDLVVTCMDEKVNVAIGDGAGAFAAATPVVLPGAHRPIAVDLDADGTDEVVVASITLGRLAVFDYDGAALVMATALDIGYEVQSVDAGDLDGDGAVDLVTAYGDAQGGNVAIFWNEP